MSFISYTNTIEPIKDISNWTIYAIFKLFLPLQFTTLYHTQIYAYFNYRQRTTILISLDIPRFKANQMYYFFKFNEFYRVWCRVCYLVLYLSFSYIFKGGYIAHNIKNRQTYPFLIFNYIVPYLPTFVNYNLWIISKTSN